MDSLLLSCRTLSFPIACRFIPAHRLSHQARKALCTRVGQTLSCVKRVGFSAFFYSFSRLRLGLAHRGSDQSRDRGALWAESGFRD